MNTNEHEFGAQGTKLLLKDEVFQLVGCAMEVLNGIGHGLHEKIYENALVVEFKLRGIAFEQQRRFEVLYKDVLVGEFIPDLITHGAIVADTKVIDRITDHERGKMINYLRVTKLRVGVLLNFKHAHLEWERIVL
jgi:GxxExxY protein